MCKGFMDNVKSGVKSGVKKLKIELVIWGYW
jgi:hypothetical protein